MNAEPSLGSLTSVPVSWASYTRCPVVNEPGAFRTLLRSLAGPLPDPCPPDEDGRNGENQE